MPKKRPKKGTSSVKKRKSSTSGSRRKSPATKSKPAGGKNEPATGDVAGGEESIGVVRLQKEAADALGITSRLLRDWTKETWFPAEGKTAAGWNIDLIREARDSAGRKGSEHSSEARRIRLDRDRERLKQDKLNTRKRELEIDEKEGELLQRRGVELFSATVLTALGDWCDQVPDLIASECPKKYRAQVAKRAKDELDAKRNELRGEFERQARELPTKPHE